MTDIRIPLPDTQYAYPCDRCNQVHRLYQRDGQLICPLCCGGRIAADYRRRQRGGT